MKLTLLCPIFALALVAPLGAQEKKADAAPKADEPAAKPAEAPAKPADPAAKPAPAAKADPTYMDKISYLIGRQLGGDFKRDGLLISPETIAAGIKDALEDKKDGKYTEDELKAAMQTFQAEMQAKQQEQMAKMQEEMAKQQAEMEKAAEQLTKDGPKNKEAGEKFLVENGKREGVTTTKSGLQYEVLKKADGPKPKATDEVLVHYKGTLINGDEFDSSEKQGQPVTIPLNGVIPGWTEGLQLMSEGSKFKFAIPAKLAYGDQVKPPKIGPHSTLVFEVELIKIGGEAAPAN